MLDYRTVINMEFRSFRETSVRDFSVIQIVLRGKGNIPQVRGWEI